MEPNAKCLALADKISTPKNDLLSESSSIDDYTFAYALLSLRAHSDESCVLLSESSSKQTSSESCTVVEGGESSNLNDEPQPASGK
ncbi:hypothetical protein EON65_18300 [archaeon]|nr:MAG: hypothetical protein EON65_18300 [archaeon]